MLADMLPIDWEMRTVGSVGEVVTGTTPLTSNPNYYGGDIPFVSPADVGRRNVTKSQSTLTPEGANQARLLPAGTILVTCIGVLGRVGQAGVRLATNQQINSLLPGADLDPAFGYWVAHRLEQQLKIEAGLQVVPIVNKSVFSRLTLPLPPLSEQRRIASILDMADEAIERTEALISKLKQAKSGLMHDLLTRGIDERGHLRDPEANPEQFKDSPLGRIPEEWEVRSCASLCREIVVGIVIKPAQYYASSGVPVLRSANVRETGLDPSNLVYMSERSNRMLAKSMIRAGDVLTVRTGYPGTSCVVPSEYDGTNCVDIIISRPTESIDSSFLSAWINSDVGKGQVLRVQGGLAQQHFNVGELQKLLVATPAIEEQKAIVRVLEAHDDRIRSEEAYLKKLRLQKRGLMEDLLTGRVRVNDGGEGNGA